MGTCPYINLWVCCIRPNRRQCDSEMPIGMPIALCPQRISWNLGPGWWDSTLAQQHRRQHLKKISHKKKHPEWLLLEMNSRSSELWCWPIASTITYNKKKQNGSLFGVFMHLVLYHYAWNMAYLQRYIMLHYLQDFVVKNVHDFHKSNSFRDVQKQCLNTHWIQCRIYTFD